ncbi:MAG: gene transfer agent family protein [Pseudomonadota bacterium]
MINPLRGEVALHVDGAARRMRLTLGALAVLEARLGVGGLIGLAERFEGGGVRGDDLIALLTAGLNGGLAEGGAEITESEVAEMCFDGGVMAAAEAAGALLAATFRGGGR